MNKLFDHALEKAFEQVFSQMQFARENLQPHLRLHKMGVVKSVSSGIAVVGGLSGVEFEDLLEFPMGIYGIAFNIDKDEIGVVLLKDHGNIRAGDYVAHTQHLVNATSVGESINGMNMPQCQNFDA